MTGMGNVMQKRHKGLDTFGEPMTIAVLENGRTVNRHDLSFAVSVLGMLEGQAIP